MTVINVREDVLGSDAILKRFPDISYRQLYYWTSRGLVTTREPRKGSGVPMSFARDQVTRIQYMGLLVNKLGINPVSASALIDDIFRDGRLDGKFVFYECDNFILALPIAEDANGE